MTAAEKRAQKAERRAANIRSTYPNDPTAERRARKAERRARNIRKYAEEQSSGRTTSGESSDSESPGEWIAGCVAAIVVLGGIAWLVQAVVDWFQNLF
jgi:hypothetical protein